MNTLRVRFKRRFISIASVAALAAAAWLASDALDADATEPIANIQNGSSCADAQDGSRCVSGFCADLSPLGFFCVAGCSSDAQCNEGSVCRFVEEGRGSRQGLCLPSRVIAR